MSRLMTGAARECRCRTDRENKGYGNNGCAKASVHVKLLVSDRSGSMLPLYEPGFKGDGRSLG